LTAEDRWSRSPLLRVLALGPEGGTARWLLVAILAHGAILFAARNVTADEASARAPSARDLAILADVESAADLALGSAADEEAENPFEPSARHEAERCAMAPSRAARAGKIVTRELRRHASDPFDDAFVNGTAHAYAGGLSSRLGVSVAASYGRIGQGGGDAGFGAGKGGGLARRAALGPEGLWDCDFPAEADVARVDHALVRLRVTVNADGSPHDVEVLLAPGHGFARAARECAHHQEFLAARDPAGHAVTGTTPPFTVRFTR